MGSIRIYKGMKISEEQQKRIDAMAEIKDEDIDFSDIPKITPEEWKHFKPARLREQKLTKTVAR